MKLLIILALLFQPDSLAVDTTKQIVQARVQQVQQSDDVAEATKRRWNMFRSYFYHLAKTPAEVTAIVKWTVCTVFVWFMLFKYRERAIHGMEASNAFWEGGEQVTYFTFYAFFPILFHIGFFQDTVEHMMVALYITSGIMIYQVTGRYIFDWALAFRTGGKIVTEEKKEVTIQKTETETQTQTK